METELDKLAKAGESIDKAAITGSGIKKKKVKFIKQVAKAPIKPIDKKPIVKKSVKQVKVVKSTKVVKIVPSTITTQHIQSNVKPGKIVLVPRKMVTSSQNEPIKKKPSPLKLNTLIDPRPSQSDLLYQDTALVAKPNYNLKEGTILSQAARMKLKKPEYSKQVSENVSILNSFRDVLNKVSVADIKDELDAELHDNVNIISSDIHTIPDRTEAMTIFMNMVNSSYGKIIVAEPLFISAVLELSTKQYTRKGIREAYILQPIAVTRNFMNKHGLINPINKIYLMEHDLRVMLPGCDLLYLDLSLMDNIKYSILNHIFRSITTVTSDSGRGVSMLVYCKSSLGLTYEDYFAGMGKDEFDKLYTDLGTKTLATIYDSLRSKAPNTAAIDKLAKSLTKPKLKSIKQATNSEPSVTPPPQLVPPPPQLVPPPPQLVPPPPTTNIQQDTTSYEYKVAYKNALNRAYTTLKTGLLLEVKGRPDVQNSIIAINEFTQNDEIYMTNNWMITYEALKEFIDNTYDDHTVVKKTNKGSKIVSLTGYSNLVNVYIPNLRDKLDAFKNTMSQYEIIPKESPVISTSPTNLALPPPQTPSKNTSPKSDSTPSTPGTPRKFNSLQSLLLHIHEKFVNIVNDLANDELLPPELEFFQILIDDMSKIDINNINTFAEYKQKCMDLISTQNDLLDDNIKSNKTYIAKIDFIKRVLNTYELVAANIPSGSGFSSKKIIGGSLSQDEEIKLRNIIDIKSINTAGKHLYIFTF